MEVLGRKGAIDQFFKQMGRLAPEERARAGKLLNDAKGELEAAVEARKEELARKALHARLDREWVDLTLPAPGPRRGYVHPITRIQRELEELFVSMGFAVLDGPEVETEYYNFDALNIPADHPARDSQDTFWLPTGDLLRTHTSPVQVRGMERLGPPLRMIAPGRVFRNESVDASHEHTFYQIEGMMIDREVSVAHLLYFMKTMLAEVFRREVNVRLRPGFFPFVEPGFELDVQCLLCNGSGCSVCKQSGWVEQLGVRPGAPQRAAHERHRPRAVERLGIWPGPHAPGHDALRNRRYPLPAERRFAVPGAVLSGGTTRRL